MQDDFTTERSRNKKGTEETLRSPPPCCRTSPILTALRNRRADGLDLGVLLEDFVSHFTAPAGLFVSAKRERCIEHVVAVDPNGPCAEQLRNLIRFFDVAS